MKRIFALTLFVVASLSHAQTVPVSAAHFGGNGTEMTGTISWQPALINGQPASFHQSNGGITTVQKVTASVTNGVFTLTLPDTSLTTPKNVCYIVTAINSVGNQQALGPGFTCVQPHGTSTGAGDWCASGACNFDNYAPNIAGLPTQYIYLQGSGFLPLSGGSLSGPLTLAADPTNPLGAATKEYVDNSSGGRGTTIPGQLLSGTATVDLYGSQPDPYIVCNYAGADLGAKIQTALTAVLAAMGGYRGTFDASCAEGSIQSISENVLSATPFQTAGTSTPVNIILPKGMVLLTATQSWLSNDVKWLQDGLTGQASMTCGSGFSGPIFNIGSVNGIYRTAIHTRLQAGTSPTGTQYCPGTLFQATGAQEGSDFDGLTAVGANSATTTTPTVICTDCLNFEWNALSIAFSGLNYALEFAYNSSLGNTTQGMTLLNTSVNNTLHSGNAGLSGIYFPTSSAVSHVELINPHVENFGSGVEFGNNISGAVHGMFTTGANMTNTILLDSGGSTGGISADNICDGGTATYLINDQRNSVTVAASAHPFGSHACVAVYPLPTTSTGPAGAIQSSNGSGGFLGTANATVDSSGNGSFHTLSIPGTGAGQLQITAGPFSGLPTCTSGLEGTRSSVTDSTTATYAATITGSGSNHVPAYCNGTNWVVD